MIGQQWAVHLPLPAVRRRRDPAAGAAGRTRRSSSTSRRWTSSTPSGPTSSGVKADADPRRRQRRLRRSRTRPARSTSAAPSCAGSGTARCTTPAGSSAARVHDVDRAAAGCRRAGRPRPAALPTRLLPRAAVPSRMIGGAPTETATERPRSLAPPARLQPAHRDRPRRRRLLRRLAGSATRSARRAIDYVDGTDQNDVARLPRLRSATIGFLVGLGFLNYPVRAPARPAADRARERDARRLGATSASAPTTRWSASSTCTASALFFFIGGLNAMLIRTELLPPPDHSSRPAST